MPVPSTPKIPGFARVLVLLAAAVALLGSIAGIGAAVLATPQILWFTLGFSIIALISAILGLLAGLGRFAAGYGMATLCIGGAIALAAAFSMLDLRPNLHANPTLARLVMPWVAVQVIPAAAIVFAGGVAVLARRAESRQLFARGMMFLVPAGVVFAAMWAGWGTITAGKNGQVMAFGALIVGGTILGTLVSAGGHYLIRAFEITAEEKSPPK